MSVEPSGNADVYCLTVPGLSAFAVGSGVVVHNTRYVIMDDHRRAKTKPGTVKDTDPTSRRFGGSGLLGWLGT